MRFFSAAGALHFAFGISNFPDYYTGRENFEGNPQEGTTRYFFDERGRAAGSCDPEGNANSMTYYGQDRVVARTTGANETTAYSYDAAHNLTRIEHPCSFAIAAATLYQGSSAPRSESRASRVDAHRRSRFFS